MLKLSYNPVMDKLYKINEFNETNQKFGDGPSQKFSGTVNYNDLTTRQLSLLNPTNKKLIFMPNTNATTNVTLTVPEGLPISPAVIVSDALGNLSWNSQIFSPANVRTVTKSPTEGQYATIEAAIDSCLEPSDTNRYRIIVEAGKYSENLLEVPSYIYITGILEESVVVTANGDHDLFHLNTATSLYQMTIVDVPQKAISCVDTGSGGTNGTYVEISKVIIYNSGVAIYTKADLYDNNVYMENVDTQFSTTAEILMDSSPDHNNFMQIFNFTSSMEFGYAPSSFVLKSGAYLIANNIVLFGDETTAVPNGFNIEGNTTCILGGVTIYGYVNAIYAPEDTSIANIQISSGNFYNNSVDINILNVNTTGYFFGITDRTVDIIPEESSFYVYNKVPTLINVANKGGDYSSIAVAVNSITNASIEKQYIVQVNPGTYYEPPFSTKDYVNIYGISTPNGTTVIPNMTDTSFITHASTSTIANLTLSTNSDDLGSVDNALIYCSSGTPTIVSCIFNTQGGTNIIQNTFGGNSILTIKNISIMPTSTPKYSIRVSATLPQTAVCNMDSCSGIFTATSLIALREIKGSGATLILSNTTSTNNAQVGYYIHASDGSTLQISNTALIGFDVGLYIANSGDPPIVQCQLNATNTGTYDINILHPDVTGFITGTIDNDKTVCVSNNISFQISQPGKLIITGEVLFGENISHVTNMTKSIKTSTNMGVLTGGTYSADHLDITVTSGTGYLTQNTYPNDTIIYLSWTTQMVSLPPNTLSYIFIDNTGVLNDATTKPNIYNNIIICSAYTNSSGVLYYQDIKQSAAYIATKTTNTMQESIGTIINTGLTVTENETLLHLDISEGSYYFGNNLYASSGQTNLLLNAFYRDIPSGYLINITSQVPGYYDDNSGTLKIIPNSSFIKHTLYANTDLSGNITFLFVYGQQVFNSLSGAITGSNPIAPTIFVESVIPIAGIVLASDAIGSLSIASIIDIRPTLKPKTNVSTVLSDHNSLSNLATGDVHTQYLRTDGTRTLTGDLNLGGYDITHLNSISSNTETPDTINVFAHEARHLPNGLDPLPVGTPVTIGVSNASGSANSFSRSDHIHAHGNLLGGTLHDAVTQLANGFMTSTDKTKLDNATANSTVNTLALRDASGNLSVVGLTCTSTDEATDLTTGALHIKGGLSVMKSVRVGGLLIATNTTDATDIFSGSLIIEGGMATQKNVFMGENLTVNDKITTDTLEVTSTQNATDADTGSLHVSGGASIVEDLVVGNNVLVSNNLTANTILIVATENATDNSTGALHVIGGVSVEQDLYVGGATYLTDNLISYQQIIASTINATDTLTGAIYVNGGMSVVNDVFIGNNTTINNTLSSNKITVTSSDNATSSSTGAVRIIGGMSVVKDVNVSGLLKTNTEIINSTINAISVNSGAFQVYGGSSVSKDIYVGGKVVSNTLQINSVENATDTQTGSIKTAGGISVQEDIQVGNDVIVLNNIETSTEMIHSTINASALHAGALQVSGGVSIEKDIYVGGNSTASDSLIKGILKVISTGDANSITSGSVQVMGGMSVEKNVFVGDNLNVFDTITSENLILNNTNDATDLYTGALHINGGASFTDCLFIGDCLTLVAEIQSTDATTGDIVVAGGVGIRGNANVGSDLNVSGNLNGNTATLNNLTIKSSNNATSSSTGSLIVRGGVYVARDLIVRADETINGIVKIKSTIQSSDVTTGAIVIDGGIGIADSANIGNNLNVQNKITVNEISVNTILITDTNNATDLMTGSCVIQGGLSVNEDICVGGSVNTYNLNTQHFSSMQVTVTSSENATSTTTGALQVVGGTSIGDDLIVGNNIVVGENLTSHSIISSEVSIISSVDATDTNTGSLQVLGGGSLGGNLYVGGDIYTSDVYTNNASINNLIITSTINSTSVTTGSIVTFGGLGVASNINIGGNEIISGTLSILSSVNAVSTATGSLLVTGGASFVKDIYLNGNETMYGTMKINNNTGTVITNAGAFQVTGGAGIGQNLVIGGDEYIIGSINILSTIEAVTITSGALTVVGGAYIGKNMKVIGNETISGILAVNNSTDASSTTTGAIVLNGGMGIQRSVVVGGKLLILDATDTSSISTGAVQITGGLSVNRTLYLNDDEIIQGQINLQNTVDSTDNITGSLISLGGVGILKSLNVGGTININNSTDTTSLSTGALITTGGVSIAKSLQVGNILTISASQNSTDITTGSMVIVGGAGIENDVHIGVSLTTN